MKAYAETSPSFRQWTLKRAVNYKLARRKMRFAVEHTIAEINRRGGMCLLAQVNGVYYEVQAKITRWQI